MIIYFLNTLNLTHKTENSSSTWNPDMLYTSQEKIRSVAVRAQGDDAVAAPLTHRQYLFRCVCTVYCGRLRMRTRIYHVKNVQESCKIMWR